MGEIARLEPRRLALDEATRNYLTRGLGQPGGKLPLFDDHGQRVPTEIVRACIQRGLATPWYRNPIKPDWLVCRLTDSGRAALSAND